MLEFLRAWFLVAHFFHLTGFIDVIMGRFVIEEKSSSVMIWLFVFSTLDWGSYFVFNAEINSKKTGASIRSIKFLSPEIALYLYKSTIQLCMEYYCHIWDGAPGCYLDMLNTLQTSTYKTAGPSLAGSFELFTRRRNIAS